MVELVDDMDFPTVGTFYDLERIGAFENPRYAVRRAELAGLVVERIGFHRRHVLDVVGLCRRRVGRIPAPDRLDFRAVAIRPIDAAEVGPSLNTRRPRY